MSKKICLIIGNEGLEANDLANQNVFTKTQLTTLDNKKEMSLYIMSMLYNNTNSIEDYIDFLSKSELYRSFHFIKGLRYRNKYSNLNKLLKTYIKAFLKKDYDFIFTYLTDHYQHIKGVYVYKENGCYFQDKSEYKKGFFDNCYQLKDNNTYNDTYIVAKKVVENNLDLLGFSETEIDFFVKLYKSNIEKYNKVIRKYKNKTIELDNIVNSKINGSYNTKTFEYKEVNNCLVSELNYLVEFPYDVVLLSDGTKLYFDDFKEEVLDFVDNNKKDYVIPSTKELYFVWVDKLMTIIKKENGTDKIRVFCGY